MILNNLNYKVYRKYINQTQHTRRYMILLCRWRRVSEQEDTKIRDTRKTILKSIDPKSIKLI
jgi:hypothetical protein